MRQKRIADPLLAQPRLRRYNTPPPSNPTYFLLWAKQYSVQFSALCMNVVREIAAYLTPLYLAGLYRDRLFIVDIITCKTYFPPNLMGNRGEGSCFQDKNRVVFLSNACMRMLEIPSLVITKLPICKSQDNFSYIRFYSECLYAYSKSGKLWGIEPKCSTIDILHLKSVQWLDVINGLDPAANIMSEVVYKDW